MFDFEVSPFRVFFYVDDINRGKFGLRFIPRVGDIFCIPVRTGWDPTGERIMLRVTKVEITLYVPDPDVPIDIIVDGESIEPR